MKTNKFAVSMVMALVITLSLAIPANASVATGFTALDKAFARDIVTADATGHYDPYATVTKGEFSDMLARAYHEDYVPTAPSAGYDEPANMGFITAAYEAASGQSIGDAPFWRYLSTGDYIARIEAVNLIVQSIAD